MISLLSDLTSYLETTNVFIKTLINISKKVLIFQIKKPLLLIFSY